MEGAKSVAIILVSHAKMDFDGFITLMEHMFNVSTIVVIIHKAEKPQANSGIRAVFIFLL